MPQYHYKAVNPVGKIIQGQIEAVNEVDLELRMSNMQLDLIRYQADKTSSFKSRKVRSNDLITITYHISLLLNAGVPLIDALNDVRDSLDHGALKDTLSGLLENISTGKTFSAALAEYPSVFSPIYINMVRVGESSGQLVTVLQDLTQMLRWQTDLIAKTKRMLTYPSFVLLAVSLVVVFLMTYLVPQLIPIITMFGGTVPWHTQVLIGASSFIVQHWFWLLGLPIAVITSVILLARYSPGMRYQLDKLLFKLWLFGPIAYKIKMARFCNYFALMYASGIAVLDAIRLSRQVMNNRMLEHALDAVYDRIAEGGSISNSFAEAEVFPPLVVRMLKAGESTGAMDQALLNVSGFFDKQVTETIEAIEPMVVPVITAVLGLVVAWVALSVIGPIYDVVVTSAVF